MARFFAYLLVATFSWLAGPASAQELTIGPRLRAGDEFRLQLTRARDNSSRPQQNAKARTVVDVRVISSGADGFTLDWAAGPATFEDTQVAQDPVVLAAASAVSGLVLRIALDADGQFTELANRTEVAARLQTALDVIVDGLAAKLPAEQRKGFLAFISQVLSPPVVIATATRDVEMYFGLNGITIPVGDAIRAEIEQPSPFGGDPIPATLSIRAESATADAAVLTTTTTYDGAALLQLTRALIERSGKAVPADELAKLPPFEMSDTGRYVLDRAVGLMREVVVNRRVAIGPNRQLDAWEFRLLTSPSSTR